MVYFSLKIRLQSFKLSIRNAVGVDMQNNLTNGKAQKVFEHLRHGKDIFYLKREQFERKFRVNEEERETDKMKHLMNN